MRDLFAGQHCEGRKPTVTKLQSAPLLILEFQGLLVEKRTNKTHGGRSCKLTVGSEVERLKNMCRGYAGVS